MGGAGGRMVYWLGGVGTIWFNTEELCAKWCVGVAGWLVVGQVGCLVGRLMSTMWVELCVKASGVGGWLAGCFLGWLGHVWVGGWVGRWSRPGWGDVGGMACRW